MSQNGQHENGHETRETSELRARWSPVYQPAWDETPQEYMARGLVGWNKSRRLARFDDDELGFKAYVGVQHFDPAQWNAAGEARTKFFLSLFLHNRTVTLRTYSTLPAALTELASFHSRLGA